MGPTDEYFTNEGGIVYICQPVIKSCSSVPLAAFVDDAMPKQPAHPAGSQAHLSADRVLCEGRHQIVASLLLQKQGQGLLCQIFGHNGTVHFSL